MPYATQYRVHAPRIEALIEEITVASPVSSAEFSSIPQIFKELRIEIVAHSTRSSDVDGILVRVGNGSADSGPNYDFYLPDSSFTLTNTTGETEFQVGRCTAASNPADSIGVSNLLVFQYAGSIQKTMAGYGGVKVGTVDHVSTGFVGTWRSTAAIDTISIFPNVGPNWDTQSVFRLYGVGA